MSREVGGRCVCACQCPQGQAAGFKGKAVQVEKPASLTCALWPRGILGLLYQVPRSTLSREAGNPDLIRNFPMSKSWQCITLKKKNLPTPDFFFFCLWAGSSHKLSVYDSLRGHPVLQSWRSKSLWTHMCSSLSISRPRFRVGSARVCFSVVSDSSSLIPSFCLSPLFLETEVLGFL